MFGHMKRQNQIPIMRKEIERLKEENRMLIEAVVELAGMVTDQDDALAELAVLLTERSE